RHVELHDMVERVPPRQRRPTFAVVYGTMFLIVVAIGFTVWTGHGLITLPDIEVTGPHASGPAASMARGAVIGGAAGVLAVAAVGAVLARKRRRANPAD